MGATVSCRFNIFNPGRKYSGNFRQYKLDSVRASLLDPATQEELKNKELYGYYGHNPRILCKKLKLQEVEAIKLPSGETIIVSNIPSNVTTAISIDGEGNVDHTQLFLETDPGKVAMALHESRVGGFSWALGGSDGGKHGITVASKYYGMDYVKHPGINDNRGYILESADGNIVDHGKIMELIAESTGMDDQKVIELYDNWTAQSQLYAIELQNQLEEAEIYEASLLDIVSEKDMALAKLGERIAVQIDEFSGLKTRNEDVSAALEREKANRKDLVDFFIKNTPVFIPATAVEALMNHDLDSALPIFESARRVDLSQLPIGVKPRKATASGKNGQNEQVGWDV